MSCKAFKKIKKQLQHLPFKLMRCLRGEGYHHAWCIFWSLKQFLGALYWVMVSPPEHAKGSRNWIPRSFTCHPSLNRANLNADFLVSELPLWKPAPWEQLLSRLSWKLNAAMLNACKLNPQSGANKVKVKKTSFTLIASPLQVKMVNQSKH